MAIFAGAVVARGSSGGDSADAEEGCVRPPLARATRRRRRVGGSSLARRSVVRRGEVGAVDCRRRDRDEWAWLLAAAVFTVLMVVLLALFGAEGDVRLEQRGAVNVSAKVDDTLWGVLGPADGVPARPEGGGLRGSAPMAG